MKTLQEVESMLISFLGDKEGDSFEERRAQLRTLFKELSLSTGADSDLTYEDFEAVVSGAKDLYKDKSFPIQISGARGTRTLEPHENANYCVAESMISVLNRKELLNSLPKFKKGK